MQQTQEDGWVEATRGFLETLYRFTCNYQGYTLINFVVLGLNMALLWIINYNFHKQQTRHYRSLVCTRGVQAKPSGFQNVPNVGRPGCFPNQLEHPCENKFGTNKKYSTTEAKFPAVTQTHAQKGGPMKSRRNNNTTSPVKTLADSEDDAETLDEITWGNDDSISPIFSRRTDSPKSARNSQAFYNSLGKVRGPCWKQKIHSTQRQRKTTPETVASRIDQYWDSENLDKWCKARKNISPRQNLSSRERHATTRNLSAGDTHINTKSMNSTVARKWEPLKIKLKLPAKIKSPIKKDRKQSRDFFIVKPLRSKYPSRDEEKTNSELSKSFSGLWRSPGGRQRMKKFTKKRSGPSYSRDIEKPNRPIKSVRCSDGGISSSSSEGGKLSDQQSAANPSDSSIVFQRDSWIWFSPETRPNAEDFASRQRKFRSQDPRVAALAEEIRRQEELNRDIERTAESLADSSSHSTGRAAYVSDKCKPSWQRGKIGTNRGNICRKSKPTSSASDHMFHYTHKCGKYPRRDALGASNYLSSTLRTPPFDHGQTPIVSRARVALDKIEGFRDKYNKKDGGVKISLGGKRKKTDCTKRSYQDGDIRNEFKQGVETDDIGTHNMTVLPLKQKAQIYDSRTGMILGSSGELLGSTNLRPDFGHHCRNQWTAFEGCKNVGVPGFVSEPTSCSDINTLNLFSSSANTQSLLPCPASVPISSLATSSRDSTQTQSKIHRENCQICSGRERCGASNLACLQAETRMYGSMNPPITGSVSRRLVHRPLPLNLRTASSADASQTDPASNPNDFAETIAFGTSTKSLGDYPTRLQNYRFQLPAASNQPVSENLQSCIAARGANSQATMSVQESSATDRDKPGLGQACLEEIITAQISAAIQKLFSESTSVTASSIPSCALNNSSSVPGLEMCKCENDHTRNSLAGDNIGPTAGAVQLPGTMTTLLPYSQDATSKSFNESPNSLRSECADTYLLDSAQSTRADNSHSCSNFSCSETKTKNQKRINIYTKAYYLGKRATKKKRQENAKTPSQTAAKSSLSPWKKPYITWSKTVSLHLYSPTNKLSPRSQIQQNKYERYLRKLKPCLKVPQNKTEQTPKYFSLSEDCRHQENSAPSEASDSTLMPMLGLDKEPLNYSNCQTSCSSAQNQNTRQHDTANCDHSKQSNILLCTSPHESNNTDLAWSHLSPKTPAHFDSSSRSVSRNPSEIGRQITEVSNSFTAISCCRRARTTGQKGCRPLAPCCNKNSPSCVLPRQPPIQVIPERPEPPPSQVSQLFYVTQADTRSNQVYSQSKDCRFSKCCLRENEGKFQVYKRSRKLSSVKKASFPAANSEKCPHSLRNQILESLAIHPGSIFVSHPQFCGKRESDENLFLKAHSIRGHSRGSSAFPKIDMGIYEHAVGKFHSDIWVTTATNNISLRHPQLRKSFVVEPPHIQRVLVKKHDLFMPPIKALSSPSSSDEEDSSSDDPAARKDGIFRVDSTCSSANSYKYFPHQILITPSDVMSVSNPDSGFDEPLSETVCLVDSSTEDSRSPAVCRSMTDDTVSTEAWCRFKSHCSDTSHVCKPLYRNSRMSSLGVSERDTFNNEFITSDPDCDTFDNESDTFSTDYDTFDSESDTSDDTD